MKTIFTSFRRNIWNRLVLPVLLATITVPALAQTKHIVEVSFSDFFNPEKLEIEVGDTVEWKNIQGSHNVNGSQESYPENPESFGNQVGSA